MAALTSATMLQIAKKRASHARHQDLDFVVWVENFVALHHVSGYLLVLAAMSFNGGCLRDCWMDLKDTNGGFGYVLGNWGLSEVITARRSGFVVGWLTKSI
uniref:Uncharacterized protein n=1 Tax=Fagus sylvatica TaxID=28930 RepID=A0A2N9IW45_FAGSY